MSDGVASELGSWFAVGIIVGVGSVLVAPGLGAFVVGFAVFALLLD